MEKQCPKCGSKNIHYLTELEIKTQEKKKVGLYCEDCFNIKRF